MCLCCALQDAVVKGWFRTTREPTKGGTHLRVVALTAYEVASAMAYIHSHGIAHLVSMPASALHHCAMLSSCQLALRVLVCAHVGSLLCVPLAVEPEQQTAEW